MPKQLTRKQEAFVKHLINNPKDSGTRAALATYGKPDKPLSIGTAQQIAHDNLMKPNVKSELAKYSTEIEDTLYRAVTDWGTHDKPRQREIALDAAKYIHDKIHGKATQQIETKQTSVTIAIDLTGTQADSLEA